MERGKIVPDRNRHVIRSRKLLLTTMQNLREFYLQKALPKETKFNAQNETDNILATISDWR
jgi:hypothetical protein